MGLDISTGVYRARKKCGFTQSELGKALGVGANTISSYETGKTQPSMDKIMKLSQISGLSIGEILTYSDYHRVNSPIPDIIKHFRRLTQLDTAALTNKRYRPAVSGLYYGLLKSDKYNNAVEF